MGRSESGKTESAWNELFDKYDIVNRVGRDGSFSISAEQIKEFREPRLMAKFDHRDALPKTFKDNDLGILPISRGDYVIGRFDLFSELPQPNETVPLQRANLPSCISSVSPGTISSEAVALNCAWDAGILHRFLGEENLFPTLSGRMGSNRFDFSIHNRTGKFVSSITVEGVQIEVDAAYEGDRSLTLFEAKMNRTSWSDSSSILSGILNLFPPANGFGRCFSRIRVVCSILPNTHFRTLRTIIRLHWSGMNDIASTQTISRERICRHC